MVFVIGLTFLQLELIFGPFLGTKLVGFSIGRGSGALKGLTPIEPKNPPYTNFK